MDKDLSKKRISMREERDGFPSTYHDWCSDFFDKLAVLDTVDMGCK